MSEHICLTALLTLPKPQQLRMIEMLRQSTQQKEAVTASTESISIEQSKSCSVDGLGGKSLEK